MAKNTQGIWQLTSHSNLTSFVCRSCRTALHRIQRRHATSASSPLQTAPVEQSPSGRAPPSLTAAESHSLSYKIKAGVLLSRPPLLTRDLTPFEKVYFLYQRRLNERLALPFTRYFYYQKGTPGDVEWKRKIKGRMTPARDIGRYTGYGQEAWNDEALVGEDVSEPHKQIEQIIKDAEDKEGGRTAGGRKRDEVIERPLGRMTEADVKNDLRSLNRALTRTLYLVVKTKKRSNKGEWTLPESEFEGRESLQTAAERILVQTGGANMNTWVVGNMPICHQVYNYPQSIVNTHSGTEVRGEKVFYLKVRIMGGKVDLKANQLGVEDFQWLAKEEMQKMLLPQDFGALKNILANR